MSKLLTKYTFLKPKSSKMSKWRGGYIPLLLFECAKWPEQEAAHEKNSRNPRLVVPSCHGRR